MKAFVAVLSALFAVSSGAYVAAPAAGLAYAAPQYVNPYLGYHAGVYAGLPAVNPYDYAGQVYPAAEPYIHQEVPAEPYVHEEIEAEPYVHEEIPAEDYVHEEIAAEPYVHVEVPAEPYIHQEPVQVAAAPVAVAPVAPAPVAVAPVAPAPVAASPVLNYAAAYPATYAAGYHGYASPYIYSGYPHFGYAGIPLVAKKD